MRTLVFALMCVQAGISSMFTFLPAVGRATGIADHLIVSVSSLSAAISFFSMPFWAGASDRIGRRPIILVGLGGFSVAMLLTAVAVLIGLKHWVAPMTCFAAIVLARTVFGGFGVASGPAVQAYVAEHSSREGRTAALSRLAAGQGLGSVIGPAIAPFLVLPFFGLSGPMLIFAAVGAAVFALVWTAVPPESRPAELPPRLPFLRQLGLKDGLWTHPGIAPFAVGALAVNAAAMANTMVLTFQVMDTMGGSPTRGLAFASYALMTGAIGAVAVQFWVIKAFRMQPNRLIQVGCALAALGNLTLALAPSYAVILAGFLVVSIGFAFVRPGLSAGASLNAPPGRQGEAQGAIMASMTAGLVFAPPLSVWLYQHWAPGPFALNGAAAALYGAAALMHPVLKSAGAKAA